MIIVPANTLAAGGFSVDNSIQLISQDSPRLSKTFGTPTNQDIWTFSVWCKRARLGTTQNLTACQSSGTKLTSLRFDSDNALNFYEYNGSYVGQIKTNRLFRDTSAWYHIVIVWDSGNGTAGDRMKMYVNGVEETSFSADTNPSSGLDSDMNTSGETFDLGNANNGNFFEGYLAEAVFVDGQALAPTSFGEFDEDSPTIWKPLDVSGLTFGDNGGYFDFEDSDNLGDDESGNTNDLTEANISAVHQVTDTPTNNFCILSQLHPYGSVVQAYHDGATKFVTGAGNAWRAVAGSIAVTSGKYYYELKINTASANNSYSIGWLSTNNMPSSIWTTYLGDINGPALGLGKGGTLDYSTHTANSQTDTGWTSYTNGEIIMCAIDLDNNFAYWGREGTWMKSGNPESGATGTGGFAFENTLGYDWLPAFGSTEGASGSSPHMSANFGHGSFANVSGAPSAISSAGTNASGFGVFEFNVPAGYGAICTKQMNE